MATRTEDYFVRLFDCATLHGAVERAAELIRTEARQQPLAPVDVFKLAEARGLHICEDLTDPNCPEGLLLPRKSGYTVRLKRHATAARKRFSLAHEVGHTLFYRDYGNGPKHVIGVLNRAERAAEEKICDHFAECLLVPANEVSREFPTLPSSDPSKFLINIDRAASIFSVSPYVVISRLQSLRLSGTSCLVICSSVRSNPKTSDEQALRVDFCVALGDWQNRFVWRHRALRSVGLAGAVSLYDTWNRNRSQGAFSLSDENTLVCDAHAIHKFGESVTFSTVSSGKWKTVEQSCLSASRLYSWKTTYEGPEAYVISVLAPA